MNQEVNIDNKKKKLKLYYGLLVTVLCIIGVSFAWFRLYLSQTENNTIASRTCFNTTLTEDTSKISITDAFPITDEDGLKQTPFTFTIKNNCNSYVKVYITIDSTYRESTNTSYLKDNYMKVNISPKGTTTSQSVILGSQTLTDLENNKKGYIIINTGLKANEEKSYDLRIWMDSSVTTEQGLNKNWSGKIVVVSSAAEEPAPAPNGWYDAGSGTLLAALRDDNTLKKTITLPGKEASLENEAIITSAEDDYGISYYFRGAVKNNYIQFANKCWRIVRITGDGSVKLVLHNDNTAGAPSPCSSTNNSTSAAFARYSGTTYTSAFNSSNNDNAYVGFMYGTAGSSTYADTHANTNKSTILTNLETWYENNLVSYERKLADTIWCNDKTTVNTLADGTTYGIDLGYSKNTTRYGAFNRTNGGNASLYANPSLICPNDDNGGKLSKFTVGDTKNGNGNLRYKIGLLTADEIVSAGSVSAQYNKLTYLYENATSNWWSMSPSSFGIRSTNYAFVWTVSSLAGSTYSGDVVQMSYGLRPSISLISTITISGGTGTSEDPYVIN